jgi:hypothetical protein
MEAFTIISGVAGILGLVLQIRDAFSEHKEIRQFATFLVFGIFLGSLIASLLNSRIILPGALSPFAILIAASFIILALLILIAAFTADATKRHELYEVTGIGAMAFLMILFFGGIFSLPRPSADLTIDELLEISSYHADRRNFER